MKEHPEDRIYKDREFIKRLDKVSEEVYKRLVNELRLTQEGDDHLFDYIYNCEESIDFSEYLAKYKREFEDVVKPKNK